MTQVYVSIGSNQQPEQHIKHALALLEDRFAPIQKSPVYESVAVGFDGDNFFNLVVCFDTDMSLSDLDKALDDIERQCGRVRHLQRFAPRTMDLDLLLYGDLVRHDSELHIPRREISRYAFVLKPLSDLAPLAVHPETGQTFEQMWEEGELSDQKLWEFDKL
ncbi:MAG TPA: 2-amino-4-hydroxy-6-hydroxymethyldihydropteridine diphosphokinase [Gammaproteobacteria bacterium]|nr:2-amino-4-hydroxy-6-hydroxymethyldihydropteridine diphosphokinase [Gammaproteobacteria bacterium]